MRYSEIIEHLKSQLPETPVNTLHGSLHHLKERILKGEEKEVSVPERGIYILSKYLHNIQEPPTVSASEEARRIREEDFYEKFAQYLENELEECTKAIPLGGNRFRDKWGTPDVLGVYKFSDADPIKPPLEIVSETN